MALNGKLNPQRSQPCLIVIFGASGDLTRRKLIPALFDLAQNKQLSERVTVLGISRTPMSDEQFRQHLEGGVREFAHDFQQAAWEQFSQRLHYLAADSTASAAFGPISQRMAELSRQHGAGQNVLFYLSVAPHLYETIITLIGANHLVTEGKSWCSLDRENPPWQRIIVEKPFGYDPESAAQLNRVLGRVFEEESIYRIDHYLGKDTVQNLLVFRFANSIFEPLWNRNYIDHIQVTAAETVGVEGRGEYYDSPGGGAMRDMIQSHLLQVMSLVCMEPPVSMRADDIRAEKAKVLSAARPIRAEDVPRQAVRGQYGAGQVDSKAVPAYRQEEDVDPSSQTDTYAALQLYIDTWRWNGVPMYLRSGKRMAKKLTQIAIYFKPTPHTLFREQVRKDLTVNQILINVQPDEGIRLRFEGKVPGTRMDVRSVVMNFDYCEQFHARPPEGYATLLLDAIQGDQTLFKHREETDNSWRIVQPVLDYWKHNPQEDLPNYAAGTWGPSAADVMMALSGRHWHNQT